jgi:subtilase family serine protease
MGEMRFLAGAGAALPALLLCTTALAAAPAPVLLGATESGQSITLALTLPSRDPQGAKAFVDHVTTPGDPLYRHFLSPAQYAARFGANPADYAAAVAWARSEGLTVGEQYTAGTVLPVTGLVTNLQRLFAVTFKNYRDPISGRVFYAADGEATLPASVTAKVNGVTGLSCASHFVPLVQRAPAGVARTEAGTEPGGTYLASDLRKAYSISPQDSSAKKQTVAVFEQGGFDPNDVAKYVTRNNLPNVPVAARSVDGYGTGIDNADVELEAVLDIDMLIGINPALARIIVYEDGVDSFQVALLDSLSAMASDNVVKTISISYGQDETLQGAAAINAENTVLTQMAAQGQAVFVSSGDSGAYGNGSLPLNVFDPASQPYVTGVGGTSLTTAKKQAYDGEVVWNDLATGYGATGGGVSTVWPIPDYQIYLGNSLALHNGGSGTYRNVPDIAAVGDPLTGVAVYSKLNGGWLSVGGTSVGAPIWAGFYSLANAASEGLGFGSLGFANPILYAVDEPITRVIFNLPFHDITQGTNGDPSSGRPAGYTAGQYYDNTTGLGSPKGGELAADLALLPTMAQTSPPPPPKGLSAVVTPTTAALKWTGDKSDAGYFVFAANYYTGETINVAIQKKLSASLTGLVPGNTYVYSVSAISSGGFTTSAADIFTLPKQ